MSYRPTTGVAGGLCLRITGATTRRLSRSATATSGADRRNRTLVTKVQASRSATELDRQTGAGNRNQTCVDCLPSNWTVTVLYQRSWEADLNCSLEGTNLRFFPLNYPSKLWSTVGESNTRRRVCNPPPKPLGQRYKIWSGRRESNSRHLGGSQRHQPLYHARLARVTGFEPA